jgi:hypothetical protein
LRACSRVCRSQSRRSGPTLSLDCPHRLREHACRAAALRKLGLDLDKHNVMYVESEVSSDDKAG